MAGKSVKKGLLALSPVFVMLAIYFAGSVIAGDFYKIPVTVAFVAAAIYAVAMMRGKSLDERINSFSSGAAEARIMYMVWIFVMAGAFADVAKAMGAIDSTVALTLHFVPVNYLPAGIFIATCFISMSIGTSVGTIVALTPVVTALASQIGCDTAWMVAIVVGGAFFGDNLSFISDTTIAATQTQGCSMRSKFRANFFLVLPAAVVALLLYAFSGASVGNTTVTDIQLADWVKVIPYVIVIVAALCGMNVLAVLVVGIFVAGVIGFCYGCFDLVGFFVAAGAGVESMCELIIVTMLAGGLLEIVRINGGMDFLIRVVTLRIRSKRVAEFSIAMLTALANVCTANNTIAILTVGGISRDISRKYGISPRRSASLLDTTSCFVQGFLPYGAQLLMASGLASISPLEIIPHLYYPMCVGAIVLLSIVIKPKRTR